MGTPCEPSVNASDLGIIRRIGFFCNRVGPENDAVVMQAKRGVWRSILFSRHLLEYVSVRLLVRQRDRPRNRPVIWAPHEEPLV